RRHTKSKRDSSSDVCSPDLATPTIASGHQLRCGKAASVTHPPEVATARVSRRGTGRCSTPAGYVFHLGECGPDRPVAAPTGPYIRRAGTPCADAPFYSECTGLDGACFLENQKQYLPELTSTSRCARAGH